MAKDVVMPALGMAQETGILVQWLKSEGDPVEKGELLMEVETDKATMEVEAPAAGTLANVTAAVGDEIPVGEVIALILAPGEEAPEEAEVPARAGTSAAPPAAKEGAATPATPLATRVAGDHDVDLAQVTGSGKRIKKDDVLAYIAQRDGEAGKDGSRLSPASPKARRLARDQNLDVADLSGSGPGGAVVAADVEAAVAQMAEAPVPARAADRAPATADEISKKWRVMARRLTESWQTVPHFYLSREANASRLLAWRESALQRHDVRITVTDLLVKLIAVALGKHPRVNASWREETIVRNEEVNVGLAVAVEDGLIVPVIHRADRLGLQQIAERRKEMVERALADKPTVADLQDGTFTLSNLGMFGVDEFSAIVNPPQAAILAVGRIADKVVPLNGQPAVLPTMTLTLACDHRVVDGARGARFLETVVGSIEEPLAILD